MILPMSNADIGKKFFGITIEINKNYVIINPAEELYYEHNSSI